MRDGHAPLLFRCMDAGGLQACGHLHPPLMQLQSLQPQHSIYLDNSFNDHKLVCWVPKATDGHLQTSTGRYQLPGYGSWRCGVVQGWVGWWLELSALAPLP